MGSVAELVHQDHAERDDDQLGPPHGYDDCKRRNFALRKGKLEAPGVTYWYLDLSELRYSTGCAKTSTGDFPSVFMRLRSYPGRLRSPEVLQRASCIGPSTHARRVRRPTC